MLGGVTALAKQLFIQAENYRKEKKLVAVISTSFKYYAIFF